MDLCKRFVRFEILLGMLLALLGCRSGSRQNLTSADIMGMVWQIRRDPDAAGQERHLREELDAVDPSLATKMRVYAGNFYPVDSVYEKTYGCDKASALGSEGSHSSGGLWLFPCGGTANPYLLAILSCTSPKQTVIFRINHRCKVKVLYDTFKDQSLLRKSSFGGIDYICGITASTNALVLHEGYLPGPSQHSPAPRDFILSDWDSEAISLKALQP